MRGGGWHLSKHELVSGISNRVCIGCLVARTAPHCTYASRHSQQQHGWHHFPIDCPGGLDAIHVRLRSNGNSDAQTPHDTRRWLPGSRSNNAERKTRKLCKCKCLWNRLRRWHISQTLIHFVTADWPTLHRHRHRGPGLFCTGRWLIRCGCWSINQLNGLLVSKRNLLVQIDDIKLVCACHYLTRNHTQHTAIYLMQQCYLESS